MVTQLLVYSNKAYSLKYIYTYTQIILHTHIRIRTYYCVCQLMWVALSSSLTPSLSLSLSLSLSCTDSSPYIERGEMYCRLFDVRSAIANYTHASKLVQTHTQTHTRIQHRLASLYFLSATLIAETNTIQAITYLGQAITLYWSNAAYWLYR